MIRIIIADDQLLFREALQTVLAMETDIEVVAAANNGAEAYDLADLHRPDIVLMDVEMPVMGGIESTKRIKAAFPDILVLILSTFAEDEYIVEGLAHGASGYVLKDMPADRLLSYIRQVVSGEQVMLAAPVAAKLAKRLRQQIGGGADATHAARPPRKPGKQADSWTDREREVIALMLRGLSNKEIAAKLFIGEGTVRNYISLIYEKLGTNSRSHAILLLQEQEQE